MSEAIPIGFEVHCEAPGNRVVITSDNQEPVPIPFNVTRHTYAGVPGPARIEAQIVPLEDLALPAEGWEGWLSLEGEREGAFDEAGFRNFTVQVRLPAEGLAPLGEYRFALRVLGVDDPDEQFVESNPVTITVKGRKPKPFAYLVIVLAALLIVAGAVVGGVFYLLSKSTLTAELEVPTEAVVGQTAAYTLTVRNTRAMTLTNVNLHYTPPSGVLDATADVPGAAYRRCEKREGEIQCGLGALGRQERVTVTLSVVPAPGAGVITNTDVMTLTYYGSRLKEESVQPHKGAEATQVISATRVSAVLVPSVGHAAVDEVVTLQAKVWDQRTKPVTPTARLPISYSLIYELPPGWRYDHGPPANCTYRTYFEIQCPLEILDPIQPGIVSINLVPSQMTVEDALHTVRVVEQTAQTSATTSTVTASLALPVSETDLYFDGQDDYAELGYEGTPESLTVEMWVHPYSTDDGQAFIGAHARDGANLLLIGYYEGGLHVNLRDTRTTITGRDVRRTERHHLAVTVKKVGKASEIGVFIDGELQAMPAVVEETLDKTMQTRKWVLGQDWDRGPSGPLTSDFFFGRLSDVSLWSQVRSPGDILDDMHRTLSGDEIRQAETLIGYWPLVPDPNAETTRLVDRVSQYNTTIPDRSGERHGASWRTLPPRSGLTLQFDGVNDVAQVPDLVLPTGDSARDAPGAGPYAVTFAAWVYVDELPSTAQWIVGQVGAPGERAPRPSVTPTPGEVAESRDAVATAQDELLAALQAARQVDVTAQEALSAAQQVRQELLTVLPDHRFVGGFPNFHEADYGSGIVYGTILLRQGATEWRDVPASELGIEDPNDIAARFKAIDKYARDNGFVGGFPNFYQADYGSGTVYGTILLHQGAAECRDVPASELGDEYADHIETRFTATDAYARANGFVGGFPNFYSEGSESGAKYGTILLRQGAAEWRDVPASELGDQPLVSIAARFTATHDYAVQPVFPGIEDEVSVQDAVTQARKNLFQLASAERALADALTAPQPDDASVQNAAEDVSAAQVALGEALAELEPALQSALGERLRTLGEMDPNSASKAEQQYLSRLYKALLTLSKLQMAEVNLAQARATEAAVLDAQAKLTRAQAQADQAEQEQAKIAADLAADRPKYVADLLRLMENAEEREKNLEGLDKTLENAWRESLEASLNAARQHNLERWIGPFLDFVLGTHTPLKSTQQAIYPVALMAARSQIKRKVDFEVDEAQAELDAALDKRDVMRNARGDSLERRQQIIDSINEYLRSLDAEVNAAQKKLDEAKDAQKGAQEQADDIPVEIAEALSQAIAQVVTDQLVGTLSRTNIETLLAEKDQATRKQLEAAIQVQIKGAVPDAVRLHRVRLLQRASSLDRRLRAELEAGTGSWAERQAKQAAQGALSRLVERLYDLLDYKPAEEVSLGTTVYALVEQAAAAVETGKLDDLTEAYEGAREEARMALDALMRIEGGKGTPTVTPTPTPGGDAEGKETPIVTPTPGGGAKGEGTPTVTPTPAGESAASAGDRGPAPGTPLWGALIVDPRGHAAVVARQGVAGVWAKLPDRKPLPTHRWVHYTGVITFTAEATPTLGLYRDGVDVKNDPPLIVEQVDLEPAGCVAGVYVGGLCETAQQSFFRGRLDDIRIWERALTEDEAGRWLARPGEFYDEVAYWPLDDGPGRQVAQGTCTLAQSCNVRVSTPGTADRANDRYHLPVSGPAWVEAELGQADFVADGGP
jgi:uncharacterized repeat protein (TIGR01451 family)